MKIAYVVPYVPNLIRTRPYNLITRLAALGHEVEVFTLGSSAQDVLDVQALRGKCRDVRYHVQPVWRSMINSAIAIPSHQPLQSVYSWHGGMAQELSGRIVDRQFDVVHVEHLRGSRYGVFLKSKFPNMPVVWDSVDCISHLFQQAAGQGSSFFGKFVTRFELSRTRRAEGDLLCSFDHVVVTSPADLKALLELVPDGREPSPTSVLPNGVDLEYFHPQPGIQRELATIVVSGKMSYHANIAMVKYLVSEVMPRVWKARPEARLLIVGKDPPSEIRKLETNPQITVTGTVEDIRPFLWRATLSVVPLLYGAGIQNKILEAMATGTPVLATSRALAALHAKPGRDLLVADNVEEFAQSIVSVIDDRNLMQGLGDAGLAYVRNHHDWNSIASQMTDIYQCVVERTEVRLN